MKILTEPKNALCKQYQKLLSLDGIELEFEEASVRAIAQKAIQQKSGARGLRAIIEGVMLDTMFELPSREDVSKCVITDASVKGEEKPTLILGERKKVAPRRRTRLPQPQESDVG